MTFRPVGSRVNFPELEEQVLRFWHEHDIHRRSERDKPADAPRFVLYEGPPTANGSPGIHHVLSRVFKDVIPRYKTMRGYRPLRKGGWDTHGLPVELEVEKELGITSKHQIEEYGVEAFNERCRESVFRYVREWEHMTERVGFWLDMQHPYVTLHNSYIESCWWILKQLWDKGLLYQGVKGTPHCPRCVTSLSSHEVALGYQEDTPDPSIYVKFRVDPGAWVGEERPAGLDTLLPRGETPPPTYIVAWTTTPWTLPGNTALAVSPGADYAVVELAEDGTRERLVLAAALLDTALQRDDYHIVTTIKGADLASLTYEPLYNPWTYGAEVRRFLRPVDQPLAAPRLEPVEIYTWHVVADDMVSLEDGTGVVHIAPAFGDEDLGLGRGRQLAFVQPVDVQGNITGAYPFAGQFVKDADEEIMQELQRRGLLYRRDVYHHTYPFCWRCDMPLLYYAKESWYIATTAKKDRLVTGNQEINWYPGYIREGRFGEWLRNNVDWAISRERYWGTPLPIWRCTSCEAHVCIGSVSELQMRADSRSPHGVVMDRLKSGDIDLHRPSVDDVTLHCAECGGSMVRIPEIMDVWFDSGAMPISQWHYPMENSTIFEDGRFPADYICEAVDQTRGWFYSLHAISTLLFDQPCYRNVICLGLVLDEDGDKMSKSKGNVVDPWEVIRDQGADPLRWYLFTATAPGNARRFSGNLVAEVVRRFFLTLWNTYSFFVTYANLDGYKPETTPRVEPGSELDRWALSELHRLIRDVTHELDNYNPTDAGRLIEAFVDDLSNWYVRRSRRRFWKSENDQDKESAYATLYECLVTLVHLIAPLAPFVAEKMYQNLVRSVDVGASDSVHLSSWPEVDASRIDDQLSRSTQLAMHVASLGRAARSKAKVRVRQPLRRALVKTRTRDEVEPLQQVTAQVLDELNVKDLQVMEDEEQVVEFRVRLNHAVAGPKYGQRSQELAQAVQAADATAVARRLRAGFPVDVDGHRLEPDDVLVETVEKPGYAIAQEGGYVVALEMELTQELQDEGFARELVHRVQNLRRSAGFDIADRITLWWQGSERTRRVLDHYGEYIQQEILADRIVEGGPDPDARTEAFKLEGEDLTVGVKRAS